jgi:hypothetical protein
MAEIIDIPNELKALQHFVDGYIQMLPFPGIPGAEIIIDEEGKLKGNKLFNRPIKDTTGKTLDWLFGDVLVVGTKGAEFADLTPEQADTIAMRCRMPHGAIYVEG